jgi:hypothetical protein
LISAGPSQRELLLIVVGRRTNSVGIHDNDGSHNTVGGGVAVEIGAHTARQTIDGERGGKGGVGHDARAHAIQDNMTVVRLKLVGD